MTFVHPKRISITFLKNSRFTVGSKQDLERPECRLDCCRHHCDNKFLGSMFGNFFMTLSTTEFQGQAPSMSWKIGSDVNVLVTCLEIIFCWCEFLSLLPTAYQWVRIAILVRWWLENNGSPDARPDGSGWLGCNRSGDLANWTDCCASVHIMNINVFNLW